MCMVSELLLRSIGVKMLLSGKDIIVRLIVCEVTALKYLITKELLLLCSNLLTMNAVLLLGHHWNKLDGTGCRRC